MHVRHITRIRLVAATVAVTVGALAAGPTASAKLRIPEEPEATIGGRENVEEPAAKRAARYQLVSLGHDNRYGLELFVLTVDGRRGIPLG